MKKLLLLTACISLFLFSCKKNSSSPGGGTVDGISATVDGATVTFNTSVVAAITNTGGTYNLSIIGYRAEEGNSDLISIEVNGDKPIAVGTYTWPLTGSATHMPVLSYNQHSGNNSYVNDAGGAQPVTVVISSISAKSVSGTFNGTIVLTSGTTGAATKTIADGKFTATIQ